MSKYGLGMRTIKTAISVFICLGIAQIIGYQAPLYACVAAIVCMQESPERSFDMGRIRLIGTGVGGVVGIAFLWVFSFAVESVWMIGLIPVAIVVGFILCNLLRQKAACAICGVVVIAVMFTTKADVDLYLYALTRIAETAAGVVVTVAVNALIFSRKSEENQAEAS